MRTTKRGATSGPTSDERGIREQLTKSVLLERSRTHQSPTVDGYRKHATCTEHLMEICRAQPNWNALNYSQKETIYMVCHKMARILTGNPSHLDHWQDISGYAMLIVDEINNGLV